MCCPSLLFTGLHLGIFPAPSVILWTLFIISEDSRFFCVLLLFPYFYFYSLALNNIENWNTNSNSPSCECSHMDRVEVVNNLPTFLISSINQLLFSATTRGLEIGSFACLNALNACSAHGKVPGLVTRGGREQGGGWDPISSSDLSSVVFWVTTGCSSPLLLVTQLNKLFYIPVAPMPGETCLALL